MRSFIVCTAQKILCRW